MPRSTASNLSLGFGLFIVPGAGVQGDLSPADVHVAMESDGRGCTALLAARMRSAHAQGNRLENSSTVHAVHASRLRRINLPRHRAQFSWPCLGREVQSRTALVDASMGELDGAR
jgi:hypothetical protein